MDCDKSFILLKSLFPDAVLITGSWNSPYDTAELYVPSTGLSCSLPKLPNNARAHTLESSGLMCGGVFTPDTCLQWSPDTGSWSEELTLNTGRTHHVSWTPDNGIGTYLMGGYDGESGRTTTLVKPDGTQETAFPLKYDTRWACAIPQEDSVIVTGGLSTKTIVSVYNTEGWLEDLPPLNTGRSSHACTSYWSGERRVFMVTGGHTGSVYLDSTETLATDASSWVTSTAKLPRPMDGLRAANIDDRVLIFGNKTLLFTHQISQEHKNCRWL